METTIHIKELMMLSIHDFHYSSDAPYPPIKAESGNPAYARVMLDNIGGSNSEMSAISLYVFNHLITEYNPDVSAVFHKVSIVEMHHLEIFGKLALQLGEEPRLWTQHGCKKIYWSPSCNQYPGELRTLMRNVIDGEKAVISKYQHQISYIRDENITENLRRIILDERLHVEIFEKVYGEYCS